MPIDRRALMLGTAAAAVAAGQAGIVRALVRRSDRVVAIPLGNVRLKPSIFADAQAANRSYLLSLKPDRLLHRFHVAAGLPAKDALYGGWEAQSISGHTLGHYLSACALLVANTGDPSVCEHLLYTVAELRRIQAVHGDGYVGGTTTWGQTDNVNGKQVFEDLRQGRIKADSFSVNGGWVPIYTLHKVLAGLIAAHQLAATPHALDVAIGLADYFGTIIERLSGDQVQQLLVCEHGGINDSFAEMYAITGNPRWLAIARQLRHRAVLDPLAAGRDELAGLHANTQIPKVIGLARLHELTGDARDAAAARFFHAAVTRRHSYVIGGNSDREHFAAPDQIASHLTETTCEACNSYNMLKLTRHLYAWQPHARWFDFYERAQLNHIMAHQRPDTGQFVYFMPMAAGGRRSYSTPTDSFWCCVGSGMESHAKHADSIYWRTGDTLYVNLFIASQLVEPGGFQLDMDTGFPNHGAVRLTVTNAPRAEATIALRLPGWCEQPSLSLNGAPLPIKARNGYAGIRRRWKVGDVVNLELPMILATVPAPDDADRVSFLSGPLVLAADMGPADKPFDAASPALIADGDSTVTLQPVQGAPHRYRAATPLGGVVSLAPFFNRYDRRTAVYLPRFTTGSWARNGPRYVEEEAQRIDLARRTIDTVFLGEQQPEVDHQVEAASTERVQINGRSGRRLRPGNSLTMRLARRAGPMLLRSTLWGEDVQGRADVLIDGNKVGELGQAGPRHSGFVSVDIAVPTPLVAKDVASASIKIVATTGETVLYEVGIIAASPDPSTAGAKTA